jgi:hypothetical protein
MTIIEAVNQNKPFKRQHWTSCFEPHRSDLLNLTCEDLLATDWEVEEPRYMVTKGGLKRAWDIALRRGDFDLFCWELGIS